MGLFNFNKDIYNTNYNSLQKPQVIYKDITKAADIANSTSDLAVGFECFNAIIDGYIDFLQYSEQYLKEEGILSSHEHIKKAISDLYKKKDNLMNTIISRTFKEALDQINASENTDEKLQLLQNIYSKIIMEGKDDLTSVNLNYLESLSSNIRRHILLSDRPVYMNPDGEIYLWEIYESFFDDWHKILDKFKESKDVNEKIALSEESLLLLPDFVKYSLETYDQLTYMPCKDFLPRAYMRFAKWEQAERVIRACIRADAYYPETGESDLQYLYQYENISQQAIDYIHNHPGCLQRNMYRTLNVDDASKKMLMDFLKYSYILEKKRIGNTNALYLKDYL